MRFYVHTHAYLFIVFFGRDWKIGFKTFSLSLLSLSLFWLFFSPRLTFFTLSFFHETEILDNTALVDNVFFYRDRTGWARGPCNLECMRKCWVNDIIDEHTLTWCNGLSEFLPIRNVRGLQRHIENPATKLHKFFVRTFVRTEKMLDEARAKHVEEGRSQGARGSMDKAQVTAAWEERVGFAKRRALEKRQEMLAQHGKENLDEVVDIRTKKFMGIPYSWLKKKDEESYDASEDDLIDRK